MVQPRTHETDQGTTPEEAAAAYDTEAAATGWLGPEVAFGLVVIEGVESTRDMIEWSDVVLVTGTVLANDTIDAILSDKPTVFYGVTIAGAAALLGFDRYCPSAT